MERLVFFALRLLPTGVRLFLFAIIPTIRPVYTLGYRRTVVLGLSRRRVGGRSFSGAEHSFVPRSFVHGPILTIGRLSLRVLFLFTLLIFVNTGCSSTKVHKPYNYGYALSELHRAGNPNSPPTQVVGQGQAASVMSAQTCTSYPIFNWYGEFVRYHVKCR